LNYVLQKKVNWKNVIWRSFLFSWNCQRFFFKKIRFHTKADRSNNLKLA
jgi:hypothetical protein